MTLLKIKSFLLENKGLEQTIAKNTFWLSFSEFVGRLLRVILIIYAARLLGAAGWGTFSYLTSLAAVFTIFSDIGISAVLVREVSKSPKSEAKYFSTTFAIKIALSIISFVLLVFVTPFFTGIPISKLLLGLIGLLFIFDSLRRFGTSLFRAKEKMEKEALVNIITQSIIVVGGFIALSLASTPESLAMAYAFGAGIGLLVAIYFLRENIKKLASAFDKELVKPIIKAAWPLSLAAIFGMLLVNIDTVMVGWFRGAEHVGFYSAAQKPIALLYILPSLIVGGFFPALARFAGKKTKDFQIIFEKALTMIITIAFPVAIGLILTSNQIISFVYGSEYLAAGPPLRILALTILTAFPVGIIIHAFFAHNKQSKLVPLWGAGAVLNIVLNLFLIPKQGITGAAWASLLTQLIINSLIWFKMKKVSPFSIAKKLPHILLATFMMAITILLINQLGVHVLIVIAAATLAYFASLIFSGEISLGQLGTSKSRR